MMRTYDAADRMTSVTDWEKRKTTYRYDLNGRLISTTRPNKTVETRTYDSTGQMLTLIDKKANGEIIQNYTFTYDAVGNLLTQKGSLLNRPLPTLFDFKDLSQGESQSLFDINGPGLSPDMPSLGDVNTTADTSQLSFDKDGSDSLPEEPNSAADESSSSFDVNGPGLSPGIPSRGEEGLVGDESQPSFDINGPGLSPTTPSEKAKPTDDESLLSSDLDEQGLKPTAKKSLSDTRMTYTADNRLATYNGQAVVYDANGNMIVGPLNDEMQTYVYDSRNRLTEGGQVQYGYNSENTRTSVTVDGKTTNYVINPHAALSQVLMETDENGQAQAHYVYGLGLIGREDASGTYQTYHYDRRGSTVALTDPTGEVTDTYTYGPYGEALTHAGTTEQPFQYNGRDGVMTDANGLYHMRARYYNPDIKRFINRDVLRGMLDAAQTLNRYAYVNGNPISYIDPFGLSRDGDSIWLQGGSFLLDTVPYVGSVKGFQQAFSGVNHVTGGRLSTSERWSEGVGSALSLVPIPGLKHVGKYGTDGIIGLGKKLDLQFFAGKGVGKLPGRSGAFNEAKRDASISRAQQPEKVERVPMRSAEHEGGHVIKDSKGNVIMTREYHYTNIHGVKIIIQDHSAGHIKGGQGPHFNVRPADKPRTGKIEGTKEHYPFK